MTLVLMPLLVYPLLSILFQKLLASSQSATGQVVCIVGLESEQEARTFQEYVALGDQVLLQRRQASEQRKADTASAATTEGGSPPENVLIRWVTGLDLQQKVTHGDVDVAVTLRESGAGRRCQETPPERPRAVPLSRDVRPQPERARFSRGSTASVQRGVPDREAGHAGCSGSLAGGARISPHSRRAPAVSLTTLIPLILILMTITGAVYPAIDLTAGERERGTLEALMAAPVPRLGLLIAKYFAVMAVALLTATANLLAMSITLLSTGLGPLVFGEGGLSFSLIAQVLGLLVLFAAFFSAILLAITSFARLQGGAGLLDTFDALLPGRA